jgi:hypothetical protein
MRKRPARIHWLSATFGKTVYAVGIEGDLRSLFYIEGDTVWICVHRFNAGRSSRIARKRRLISVNNSRQ